MSPSAAPRAHQPYPPLPPFPPRPETDPSLPPVRVPTPMVYVEPTFEYRTLSRELSGGEPLPQEELAQLGRDGWELVGILNDGRAAHFYFKRESR